nr:ribonuclease H-like domain-containing protein [Tanacetum cinerariifolium]
MVVAAKLLVLNPGEFELWKIKIEQYFLMMDYAIWKIIVNGVSSPPKKIVDNVDQIYPPTTAKEKLAMKNELKARGTLLMALLNEHQLKFNSYKNFKSLIEAIEKRFGGNKVSKKTQKTLLKQHYENFNRSSSEGLDQTYDRVQKLISQLEILEEMDLKWQMAMLAIRARRFLKKSGRKVGTNSSETIRLDKTKVECYNYHKRGHFARECRALRENRNIEHVRRNMIVETTDENALLAQDGFRYDWSD